MGLFDSILGRTKPVQADLDALFGLPSASITLQSAAATACSGHAGVCFKPQTGQGFADNQAEVMALLQMDDTAGLTSTQDSFGYQWLVMEDPDIEALVTRIHLVNSSLADAGWGPQLLCSVFGLARLPAGSPTDADREGASVGAGSVLPSTAYLVYLFKRGTFYPFVPTGHEQRSTEEELKLRSLVADDLSVETDLDRWFPLRDLPVP
jgi:hypothetical protein